MQHSEVTMLRLRDLMQHPRNPRKITQEDLNRLCDSIRKNGYWQHRPMAVEPVPDRPGKYYILDGNQRKKALGRLKRTEAPCMIYTELTDEERDDIILRSNINNGQWEVEILEAEFSDKVDFEAIGLQVEFAEPEPSAPTAPTPPDDTGGSDGTEPPAEDSDHEDEEKQAERLAFYYKMLGDYRYPTDNEFEVPLLLTDNQPVHLELPFAPWGAEARYKKGITTYHFYVEDYRFEALYKDPIKLLMSGCRAVIEPNNSIHDQTPVALGLWQIYRKRYLARYLQECGLQVWVDLNVSPRFSEYNLLGVPKGYNAFCTRGVSGWQATLDEHLRMAQRISGREQPNLIVYGGGEDIRQWCHERGLFWTGEYMNRRRDDELKERYKGEE